jgi:uncharacterized membrane protein (DUF485 family)
MQQKAIAIRRRKQRSLSGASAIQRDGYNPGQAFREVPGHKLNLSSRFGGSLGILRTQNIPSEGDALMARKRQSDAETTDSEINDLTALAGAATDVAPLGRGKRKPDHELTADEDVDVADWDRVAAMDEFKHLVATKRRFIIPATIFFVAYYFALPVLVGYAPELMARRVFGVINLAYVFALSQFFMAWIVAALYVRAAGRFDTLARNILNRLKGGSAQ